MALIKRFTKEQIARDYDVYGWFYGVVPVYVGDPHKAECRVAVRNWIPEWTLDAACAVVAFLTAVGFMSNQGIAIKITGEIRK